MQPFTLQALTACSLWSAHASGQALGFDAREATIDSVHDAIYSGFATCRQVTLSFLARIEALNPTINAIIGLNPRALDTADSLDEALATGNATGSLFCIPVLLKDCYDTHDMPTTGGNLALAHVQPKFDAPTVKALREAGAIILGKANLHELALEGLSVSSLGGQTVNPYDLTRTPGGSSGGSAAAVALSLSVFATGSDTVNSLRSPASANSLFSIRPTRGLISRAGIMPVTYTQDAIGPIARSVKDVAVALTVMASIGRDKLDNATDLMPDSSEKLDYIQALGTGRLQGLRVGVVEGFFNRTESNETTPVNDMAEALLVMLQKSGIIPFSITETIYNSTAIRNTSDVQRFEFRETLDAYLQDPGLGGIHPTTVAEIYSGSDFLVIPVQYEHVNTALVSSTSNSTYAEAMDSIDKLRSALDATFERYNLDCLFYPEQSNLVRKIGSESQSGRNGILAAVTGSPVVTVPVGFSPSTAEAPIGIPIGIEILGKPYSEAKLLQIAYQIEQHFPLFGRRPPALDRFVEPGNLNAVPRIVPNVSNIPKGYPLGVLS